MQLEKMSSEPMETSVPDDKSTESKTSSDYGKKVICNSARTSVNNRLKRKSALFEQNSFAKIKRKIKRRQEYEKLKSVVPKISDEKAISKVI